MLSFFKHESASVDEGCKIGCHTKIWHFTHVSAGAVIGDFVTLGQNVFVGDQAVVGDHCKIQNNVSIYSGVELESYVFCGPSVVFTNVINPRAKVDRKQQFKTTRVRQGASLGANATIVCGVTIGHSGFVGAGSVVTKDVKDFALVVGVPALQIGWVSEYGDRIPLPLVGEGSYLCPHSDKTYTLNDGILLCV